MGVVKVRGIVLNEREKGEADKMLTLFTLEMGKVYVNAKGARKLKSRYFAGSSQFDYSDFVLYSGKDFYSATQIDKVESFKNITADFDKLCYGNYFLEAVDKTTFQGEANADVLKLILYALRALDKNVTDNFCICRAFEFKLMQINGYTPFTKECADCGAELSAGDVYFSYDGTLCGDCAGAHLQAVRITPTALYALEYILNADIRQAFLFKLDNNAKRNMRLISQVFMANLDIKLNSLKLLEGIDTV